jgi:translin
MNLKECRTRLEELEKAREDLLRLVRELRINATKAIAAIHSGEEHESYLKKAIEIFGSVSSYRIYSEIYHSVTHDATQELVEAIALSKIVNNSFDFSIEIDADPSAFVTGLADVVGELRRYALSLLVEGKFRKAEMIMEMMEKIYGELISFASLPDKLVPGLRRKLDVARTAIERTKSDYIAARVAKLENGVKKG